MLVPCFNQLVIAAGGLENVGILKRGEWPTHTPTHRAGLYFQDHTTSSTHVKLPVDLPMLQIGAEAHIELPSLSGYFNHIEFKTLALTGPHLNERFEVWINNQKNISQSSLAEFIKHASRYLTLWTQIEIPPEFEMELIYNQKNNYSLSDEKYLKNLPELEKGFNLFLERLNTHEVEVMGSKKSFQLHYGGHHYTGTTPMSNNQHAVVDKNLKVLGTDNVYVVGGSVLPRTGGASPTLTIIALSLRLAEYLKKI